jgi:DNA-binding SARP family transcriptional activator
VWRAGKVTDRFPTVKSALLLAYLAAAASGAFPDRTLCRDDLAGLFWPESDPELARQSLCQALSRLRRRLAEKEAHVSLFLSDRDTVRLNPHCCSVDVAEFEGALLAAEKGDGSGGSRRRLVEALRLYRGELLAGYADTWLLAERVTLAEKYFTALRRLLALLEAAGDLEAAVTWAREGLRQDSLREELHRDLMRLLVLAGEPEAALRQYSELSRLLQVELDSSPNAATRALACAIRLSLSRAPSSMVTGVSPAGSVLAGRLTACA